ncbi:ABC-2 type transport system permease protein [Aequitasia blattaphilus]|uniref:ABC-2 transporter permease n=1 Tax=Aequitasia blattaphilus TaxID=2949332 RepID=A0ABT1EAP1_9FIRM|nr:ABC-2 transporter permease [Aequitasia blattaphilus]MCP1101572.1 ABC-2 transporter permease [Aequitasia blattaphilus]MCR8614212.1 ABC-2 transporter permease [Aequitasia blattaphilus]
MTGLLIKDFKLLRIQKTFFLLIVFISVAQLAFSDDPTFVVGYMSFVMTLFTLSSISYDEFDNGNAFLFSLPITRRGYVREKYVFGIILGGGSWALSSIAVAISQLVKSNALTIDLFVAVFVILPLIIIVLAIMLPFQLKFGGEKGRIAIIGTVGIIFILCFLIAKIAQASNIDFIAFLNNLPTLGIGTLLFIVFILSTLLLLLSYKISVAIMNKKEF